MADRTPFQPDSLPGSLHREVLPPQRQESGFGVVVVAGLAMFMAVASSAMVVRARMVKATCPASRAPAPAAPAATFTVPLDSLNDIDGIDGAELTLIDPTTERECGTPLYQQNQDGSVSVFFEACVPDEPDPAWGIRGVKIAPSIVVEISETH